jgi:hypothetical protein
MKVIITKGWARAIAQRHYLPQSSLRRSGPQGKDLGHVEGSPVSSTENSKKINAII